MPGDQPSGILMFHALMNSNGLGIHGAYLIPMVIMERY